VPVWPIVKLGLYHSRDVIAANADVPPFAAAFGQTLGPIGSEVPFIIEQDVPKTGTAPIPLPGREWTTASLTRQRCSPAVVVAQPGLVEVLVGPRITHLEIGNALLSPAALDRPVNSRNDFEKRAGQDHGCRYDEHPVRIAGCSPLTSSGSARSSASKRTCASKDKASLRHRSARGAVLPSY
jgi:hypothetical protein